MNETLLYEKMIARADLDDLPLDHPLRQRAYSLQKAVEEYKDAPQIIGAWARARRAWCEYTGEALI